MKKKRISYLFYILIIVMFMTTSFSMAKYKSTFALEDSGKIGAFVVKESLSSSILVEIQEIEPGIVKEYYFDVKNYDDNGRSDVNIDYFITVDNKYDVLPLQYEIYKSDNLDNQLFNNGAIDIQRLGFNENQTDSYILKILLPEDSWEYQNQVDEVEINIEAYQVD